jgi:hypothetical protein
MAQVTPCLATPPNTLSLAQATPLPLTRAAKRPWAVPGAMLAPHAHGAKTFDTGSLHPFARCLCPHAPHCPLVCPLVFSWSRSTALQVRNVPGKLGMTACRRKFFCVFPLRCRRLYGRNAGYAAPPVQTRTCRCPASGSLVGLASAVQSQAFRHTRSDVEPL